MNKQYRGYILLLTMIILSSIILLLFTVINTNRLAEGFSSTMLNKQEEYLLLQSGIAITQSLISSQKEKSEDKKEEKTVKEQEKTKESEISYFKLYWQKCNKWLDFTLTEKEHGQEGKIKIYLMVEDGKLPLQRILSEYNNQAKGNKNEENQTNDENQTKFKNEHEQKILSKEKATETKGIERENIEQKEKLLETSLFFKTLLEKFSPLEAKNQLLKQLTIKLKGRTQNKATKESFLGSCLQFHIEQKREKHLPLSCLDALPRNEEIQTHIFPENEEKRGIMNLYSAENKTLSLLYASPEVLELLSEKKIIFNEETRKKILEKEGELFKNGFTSEEKTWNTLYTKTLELKYPKDIIEDSELKKLFVTKSDPPEIFSALLHITTFSGSLLALVTFKKEFTKSKKDSYEYLLKSVYIIPNT